MRFICEMESWQVERVCVINFIDYNILIKILSVAIFLMTDRNRNF